MKRVKDTFAAMVLSLTLISLIMGGVLALAYEATQEDRDNAQALSTQEKLKNILPEFTALLDTVIMDTPVYGAYMGDTLVGVAITSVSSGYGGNFKIIISYKPDGTIIDYAVLEHNETPGLGAKMDTWFKKSIPGRQASETFSVSKDGGNIDAITAATISSRGFLKGVNNADGLFKDIVTALNVQEGGIE